MIINKKTFNLSFLFALIFFSFLEISGYISAILFLFIAGFFFAVTRSRDVWFPPVTLVVIAYIFGFPLVMILPDLYPKIWGRISFNDLEYGMLWSTRGFGAFALGYVFIQTKKKIVSYKKSVTRTTKKQLRYTIFIMLSIASISLMSRIAMLFFFGRDLVFIEGQSRGIDTAAGTLVQIFTLLSDLRYPFFFGFLVLHFWKQTNKKLIFLFFLLLFISILEIITIGSKASIISGIVVGLLAMSFLPIKFDINKVVLVFFVLIVIQVTFSTITEYRAIMLKEQNSFALSTQINSFVTALDRSIPFITPIQDKETEVGNNEILNRFAVGIYAFSNLLNHTNYQSPYENAFRSFLVPIYSVTPRILVPNKAIFFDSGTNASEYYNWQFGGVSVTLIGSYYYAWGYIGIMAGMFFLGVVLGYVINQVQKNNIFSPHWSILLITIMLSMIDVGVTFQSILTNLMRVGVLLLILSFIYSQVSKKRVYRR